MAKVVTIWDSWKLHRIIIYYKAELIGASESTSAIGALPHWADSDKVISRPTAARWMVMTRVTKSLLYCGSGASLLTWERRQNFLGAGSGIAQHLDSVSRDGRQALPCNSKMSHEKSAISVCAMSSRAMSELEASWHIVWFGLCSYFIDLHMYVHKKKTFKLKWRNSLLSAKRCIKTHKVWHWCFNIWTAVFSVDVMLTPLNRKMKKGCILNGIFRCRNIIWSRHDYGHAWLVTSELWLLGGGVTSPVQPFLQKVARLFFLPSFGETVWPEVITKL